MTSRACRAAALLAALSLAACEGFLEPGERAQEKVLFRRFATAAPQHMWRDSVDIYRVNADGTGLRNLTNHPAQYVNINVSPDGRRVLFESNRDGNGAPRIWAMNGDGTGLKQLTANYSRYPRWSPDGSRFAFEMAGPDNRLHVYVMNADGSNPQKVSEPAMQVGSTCDGSTQTRIELVGWAGPGRVAFARGYCGYGYRYFLVNADGSGFTQTDIRLRNVHWSPDGTQFLDTRNEGGYVRVVLMNADGTRARVLSTQGTHQGLPPVGPYGSSPWSPDGRRIVFYADASIPATPTAPLSCSGSVLPYVVNVDGSGVQRLMDACEGYFDGWSPSGEQVAFTLSPASGAPDVYAVKADGTGGVNLTGSPVWESDSQWLARQ